MVSYNIRNPLVACSCNSDLNIGFKGEQLIKVIIQIISSITSFIVEIRNQKKISVQKDLLYLSDSERKILACIKKEQLPEEELIERYAKEKGKGNSEIAKKIIKERKYKKSLLTKGFFLEKQTERQHYIENIDAV